MNAPFLPEKSSRTDGFASQKPTLKQRWRRLMFITSPLGLAINPSHIIRTGIYKAVRRLAPQVRGDVMDFGCGSKPYEELFTSARKYVGVDIAVSGHDHSDSKVDRYYDGRTIPFPDGRFDAVVCFEVIEHIFNIEEILAEVGRVTKPGGKLLLSIPFAWPEHEVPYDFARYTSFGITHVLNKSGYEVVEQVKTTTAVLAIFQLFVAYVHEHILPERGALSKILRLMVIFPLNLLAVAVNAILPKRYDFYSGIVILAKKAG